MWVRGLKRILMSGIVSFDKVAPHVGAWIETTRFTRHQYSKYVSHPMWVRGLKPNRA